MMKFVKRLKSIFKKEVNHDYDFKYQYESYQKWLQTNRDGQVDYEVKEWNPTN